MARRTAPSGNHSVVATVRPRRWRTTGLLCAVVVPLVTVGLSVPAYGQPTGSGAPSQTLAGATPHVGSVSSCPSGEAQLDFQNSLGFANSDVYATVGIPAGNDAADVTPQAVVNQSPSVPLTDFPIDPNDPSGDSFYVCLANGASGRLWISIGQPIVGLPGTQPTVAAPYRLGYIEFTYPGVVDYSNVNDFDFPVDLRTYGSPGATTAQSSAVFSGNTCQIVNAMKQAVTETPGTDWSTIEDTDAEGNFLRIVSPSNDLSNDGGWPSMAPYIRGLIGELPSDGPDTVGPITLKDYYTGSGAGTVDPLDVGWFDYQGTIDTATDMLTLNGTVGSTTGPGGGGGHAGLTMTVSLASLAEGIYDQAVGKWYDVGGQLDSANDMYARIWNDLTSAFNYGYWGSNLGGTGTDTKDFFGSFAPPTAPSGGQVAFGPGRTASLGQSNPAGNVVYNLYASVLMRVSPDYALPFGENYGAGGTGNNPDITIPTGGEIHATLPSDGWSGRSGSSICAGGTVGGSGGPGYNEVASDGGIFSFGGSQFYGSMGGRPLNAPVVGIADTPDGGGYWEMAGDGGIFSFGDAPFEGSMGGQALNKPVVGIASTPSGRGYWEVASDGGVFSFGDAQFYGSIGGQPLDAPVVGIAATPDRKGYWEVAKDGGVFSFGDAQFYGSMGGQPLNKPIVGIAATSTGRGYWEVASNGGIFSFGEAQFYGSMGGQPLNKPIVGIAATSTGRGYWEVASDGGIFSFGNASFEGSMGGQPLNKPVVSIAG